MTTYRPTHARGFTLVEMLITVTVIGIVVAMSLGALVAAQDSAREQRTRSLISKLHTQLMYRWESYQSRRIPMAPRNASGGETPAQYANRRLWAQRELMRFELPERFSDFRKPPTGSEPPDLPALYFELNEFPALAESYLRRYANNKIGGQLAQPTPEFESAECLYMVVTMGHDDSLGTTKFRAADVGDVDNDGMPEFIDGWGKPIRFLRWAPGFLPQGPYNWQSNPSAQPPGVTGTTDVATTDLQTGNWDKDHDPYDPLRIDSPGSPTLPAAMQNDPWRGYRLMPLIYSAGRDGIPDIAAALKSSTFDYSATTPWRNDPYAKTFNGAPIDRMMGTPDDQDNDGSFDHVDNLTNHALEVR